VATYSEIKAGLDEVSRRIREQLEVARKLKGNGKIASDALAAIPADFAAVITAIQGMGDVDPAERLAKAELAKLTAEFQNLKAVLDGVANIQV